MWVHKKRTGALLKGCSGASQLLTILNKLDSFDATVLKKLFPNLFALHSFDIDNYTTITHFIDINKTNPIYCEIGRIPVAYKKNVYLRGILP